MKTRRVVTVGKIAAYKVNLKEVSTYENVRTIWAAGRVRLNICQHKSERYDDAG